jgi:Ca-activated chloride channel family protein
MAENSFHFASPYWLLALAAPIVVYLWLLWSATLDDERRFAGYADAHLLPFLLGRRRRGGRIGWRRLVLWTLGWTALVLAMATPRWGFEDRPLFRSGVDLVVLLDLSNSMSIDDVAPSRIARARQEIDDLIRLNTRARIGLVAFATIAHVIAPLTEDATTLRQQLPALSPDLIRLKGSRVSEALVDAGRMLAASPKESSRHVLLISDCDFADDNGLNAAQQLAAHGIHLHVLGVGTAAGGRVSGPNGELLRDATGRSIDSRLDENELSQLAEAGNGIYRIADFRDDDTRDVLRVVEHRAVAEVLQGQTARVWNERFYWPLLLAVLLLLPLFRVPKRAGNERSGA